MGNVAAIKDRQSEQLPQTFRSQYFVENVILRLKKLFRHWSFLIRIGQKKVDGLLSMYIEGTVVGLTYG